MLEANDPYWKREDMLRQIKSAFRNPNPDLELFSIGSTVYWYDSLGDWQKHANPKLGVIVGMDQSKRDGMGAWSPVFTVMVDGQMEICGTYTIRPIGIIEDVRD